MIILAKNFFFACTKIGASDEDDEELRLKKSSLVLVPVIIGISAFLWGLLYIALDHYISAAIPLSYSFITLYNLWNFHNSKNIVPLQKIQLILVLLLPFFLMWSLGGFAHGSFVFIWAFFAPIAALTYNHSKDAAPWFYAFIALVVFSTLIDQSLIEHHDTLMPELAVELFFLLNISAGLSGLYFLIKYFINEKDKGANKRLMIEHQALLQRTEELKEANYKLAHLADHDALTGLPNRYHLQKHLSQMISRANRTGSSIALMFIDLDGFKSINDSFGHATGDEVLICVGDRITSLLREEDTVARIGGDEFALAIDCNAGNHYVETVALRTIDSLNLNYPCLSSPSKMGASIGISMFPQDGQEIEQLFKLADAAMYKAKASGKNNFKFHSQGAGQQASTL